MIHLNLPRINKSPRLVSLLLPVCFILTACSGPAAPAGPTTTQSVQPAVITAASPTELPVAAETVASSSLPSFTPVITATPTKSLATQTNIPPIALQPTLTEKDRSQFVISLLQDNGGCALPCWWGFMPGITTDQEVLQFFSSSGLPVSRKEGHLGSNYIGKPLNILQSNFYSGVGFDFKDGVLQSIGYNAIIARGDYSVFNDPVYYTYLNRYKISSVLTDLGKPEGIYLTIFRVSGGGVSHDQELILFYPDKGALLSYKGMYTKAGGKYQFCLDEAFVTIKLFLPHQYLFFKEPLLIGVSKTNQEMMNSYYDSFRPLIDSTNLDIDSFYTYYKQDNGDCLETPISLWK